MWYLKHFNENLDYSNVVISESDFDDFLITTDIKVPPIRFGERLQFKKDDLDKIDNYFRGLTLRKEDGARTPYSLVKQLYGSDTYYGKKIPVRSYFIKGLNSSADTSVNLIESNCVLFDFQIFKTTDDWFYLAFAKKFGGTWGPVDYFKCDSIDGLLLQMNKLFKK